jgi:predicted permease
VGQVAFAVVLLAGSGLLLRSFWRLRTTPTGFDPRGVVVLPIFLDMQAYDNGHKVRSYYARLTERLQALPGVVSVGGATALPTSPLGPDFERPVWPEGQTGERAPLAWVRMVTPGYFATLGMAVRDGRGFDERDIPGAARVVMVSEGLAQRLWPGESAVGRRLVIDYSSSGTYPYDVVGVVGDVRFRGPRSDPRLELYLAHAQRPYLILNVAVRSSGDPLYLAPAIRSVLHELDPQKPAHGIHSLEQLLGATVSRDRQAMLVTSAFAAAAILLSALSLYAMLALRVRERLREIAVRIALGAARPALLRWVAGYGLRRVAGGVLLGLALAASSTRALSGVLFGVSPTDPATALGVTVLPLAVGLLASLVPAWRASRVDPVRILRQG